MVGGSPNESCCVHKVSNSRPYLSWNKPLAHLIQPSLEYICIMVAGIATIVGAVTGAVTGGVMGILTTEVSREREFCRNLEENKNTLIRRVEELNVLKDGIVELRQNIRRGKMMKKEVEHWLSCVKIIYEEVQVVEKLCSVISGDCRIKAWLGETVIGKTEEVKELLRQHGNFSGDIVIDVKKNFKKLEAMAILMHEGARKLEYYRNPEKNMNTLREGVAELNQLKDDIVELRKQKKKRGKIIKKEVEHWLSRVNIINEGLQDVEKSCSAGSRCPLEKASLGKTILRKIGEVEKLIREHGSFSGDIVIDGPSTSGAIQKLKHALDRLNSQKEKVETQKSRHENDGEVVREEVNDWLIDVRSIKAVFQILKGASRRVSRCNKSEVNEIVLEKSGTVNNLLQRGTFPDGL